MKKDFLTITPDSGEGTAQVSVSADPNPTFSASLHNFELLRWGGYLAL